MPKLRKVLPPSTFSSWSWRVGSTCIITFYYTFTYVDFLLAFKELTVESNKPLKLSFFLSPVVDIFILRRQSFKPYSIRGH